MRRNKEEKLKKVGTIHDTITGDDFTVDEKLPVMRAIRLKCLECSGNRNEVVKCAIVDCTLWPHRVKNVGVGGPKKRVVSEEDKQKFRERMNKLQAEGKMKKVAKVKKVIKRNKKS